MVSSVPSSIEKENNKSQDTFRHQLDFNYVTKTRDLKLSFEDMSDALTTTASSFTLASSNYTDTSKSSRSGFYLDLNIMQNRKRMECNEGSQKGHTNDETSHPSSFERPESCFQNVRITTFHIDDKLRLVFQPSVYLTMTFTNILLYYNSKHLINILLYLN